jgi:3-hydroxyisobutyrate dehydrogenase
MKKIAVLGLGAMGSRMASNLIKSGFQVTVWNRTSMAAQALVAAGATQASTPKMAAKDADFVMAMVRDDIASRQVWLDPDNGALAGMKSGSIAIESSTLTPGWIRELGMRATERGLSLLEAPVSGTTPQAEAAQLVYFIGGDANALACAEPLLKVMGSSIQHVGELGCGALTKLVTNTLLGVQVTTLGELIGMLQHAGADVERILNAVSSTSVWSTVAGHIAGAMKVNNFTAQFPIELIEKDFGYTVQIAGSEMAVPTVAAARGVFLSAIANGLGKDNMTGVVKLFSGKFPSC